MWKLSSQDRNEERMELFQRAAQNVRLLCHFSRSETRLISGRTLFWSWIHMNLIMILSFCEHFSFVWQLVHKYMEFKWPRKFTIDMFNVPEECIHKFFPMSPSLYLSISPSCNKWSRRKGRMPLMPNCLRTAESQPTLFSHLLMTRHRVTNWASGRLGDCLFSWFKSLKLLCFEIKCSSFHNWWNSVWETVPRPRSVSLQNCKFDVWNQEL